MSIIVISVVDEQTGRSEKVTLTDIRNFSAQTVEHPLVRKAFEVLAAECGALRHERDLARRALAESTPIPAGGAGVGSLVGGVLAGDPNAIRPAR